MGNIHSVGVVLEELGGGHPLALVAAEADAGLASLEALDLRNGDELAGLHVELVDLGQVRVPEAGHDLEVERIIARREGRVPQ